MFNNPALLLWAAEADEEQARAGRSNPVNGGQVFLGSKRPERRAFNIGYVEIRMTQTNRRDQSIQSGLACAVETDRHACPLCRGQHERHKIRSADPLGLARPKRVERPYQGRAIGVHNIGAVQLAKERRIVSRFHNHVDIGKAERAGLSLSGPGKAALDHFIVAADGNIDPENRLCDKGIQRLGGRDQGWILPVK